MVPLPFQSDEGQSRAADWRDGPLVVTGRAGSGVTTALEARFRRLLADGVAPELVLIVERDEACADRLRVRLEGLLEQPWEELPVHGPHGLAGRVLRAAGADRQGEPDATALSAADRLALVGSAMDRLTLSEHDLGRDPTLVIAALIDRIDRLEAELITAEGFAEWAAGLPSRTRDDAARAAREQEFAGFWALHDGILADRGLMTGGKALHEAVSLLEQDQALRAALSRRFPHVLAAGVEDWGQAAWRLVELISGERNGLAVFTTPDVGHRRLRGSVTWHADRLIEADRRTGLIELDQDHGQAPRPSAAARAVLGHPAGGEIPYGGSVEFWQAASERGEAQAVSADIERLIIREGVAPDRIAVLVDSIGRQGAAIGVALEERAIPHRVSGAAAFFQRAEIRDLLAWLRLLDDPSDGAAAARALARPPIALGPADIARCAKIARRRRLDIVTALAAAIESPNVPPEARDRIRSFLTLHRSAVAAFDNLRPDLFIHRLVLRLRLRSALAFAASPQAVERLRALAAFEDLATAHARRDPQATARDFARHVIGLAASGMTAIGVPLPEGGAPAVEVRSIDEANGRRWDHVFLPGLTSRRIPGPAGWAVPGIPDELLPEGMPDAGDDLHAEQRRRLLHLGMSRARERLVLTHPAGGPRNEALHPSPFAEEARLALGAEWQLREVELFAPGESLQAAYGALRDEILELVEDTGKSLHELRLDTGDDIDRTVVRFLELLKVAALLDVPEGNSAAEALAAVNERLRGAATESQRAGFEHSTLDSYILEADRDARERTRALAARREPSLEAFLPRRGDGLALSASDIETYTACPLRYKFSRVMRIPQDPTTAQRFGIVVHQVLERWHREGAKTEESLQGLLEQSWRRSGIGDGEQERQLKEKAHASLTRFAARDGARGGEPLWLERSFAFKVGPHILRGRVDRVDRLPGGEFELIDYKTSFPKTAAQLEDDIQLTVYALGAREAWKLETAKRSYWYVLDDDHVEVPGEVDRGEIEATVTEVADSILAQEFEPTPSYTTCSFCDWRLACPAAER